MGRLGWGGGGFVGLGRDGVEGTEYQNKTIHIKNQYNNRKKLKETLCRAAKNSNILDKKGQFNAGKTGSRNNNLDKS